jgi:hypothetical protein
VQSPGCNFIHKLKSLQIHWCEVVVVEASLCINFWLLGSSNSTTNIGVVIYDPHKWPHYETPQFFFTDLPVLNIALY